jgi:flagellar biosynthesis anti-sigma factor FlgM
MTITNDDTSGVSRLDLERAGQSRPTDGAASSNSASTSQSPGSDSIALSTTNGIVEQALNAGTDARSNRIAELRQLVATNQYQVDAGAVSSALIDAHLRGV